MKAPLLWLAVALAIGLLAGRCSAPRPGEPSADSTRAMNARDTVIQVDSSLAGALRTAEGTIRWLRARKPPTVPPRPDSGGLSQGQTDTVYQRLAYDSVTIDSLGSALVAVRDTLTEVRKKLPGVAETLEHSADRIGQLERRRSYPWAAGVLLEGTAPVGGFISRDVWRVRVQIEASDGRNEPATVRVGVGVRF